jgi:hypothetical protein
MSQKPTNDTDVEQLRDVSILNEKVLSLYIVHLHYILAIVLLSNYSFWITPAIFVSFKITNNRLMMTINGNKSVYFIDSLIHIGQSDISHNNRIEE